MLPRKYDDIVRLAVTLLFLCTLKLPGRQMAIAVMVALGIHDFKIIGGRSGLAAAMIALKSKGVVELMDGRPEIGRAVVAEVDKKVASLGVDIQAVQPRGPALERPPAFVWMDLPHLEQEWLHAALLEAAALQCAYRFNRSEKEVRQLLRNARVEEPDRRAIGFARILKRASAVSGRAANDKLEIWLIGAFEPNNFSYPNVTDPRLVLAEWLANSPIAKDLPLRNTNLKKAIDQNGSSSETALYTDQRGEAHAAIKQPAPQPSLIESSAGTSMTRPERAQVSTAVDGPKPADVKPSNAVDKSANRESHQTTGVDTSINPVSP